MDDKRCSWQSHTEEASHWSVKSHGSLATSPPDSEHSPFFELILARLNFKTFPKHQSSGRAGFRLALSFFFIIFLDVDRPPAVDAVDAAGDDVVQVCPCRGGPRAVDLRGGIVEALVRLLLAAHAGGGGRGQVDVAVVGLVHLGLVGEQDLGLRAGRWRRG